MVQYNKEKETTMSDAKYDSLKAEYIGLKADLAILEATNTSIYGHALIRVRMTEIEFELTDADNHKFQQAITNEFEDDFYC